MRILVLVAFLALTGCTSFAPKDLKSPCVAITNPDGLATPCVKRSVNNHWLI